MFWGHFGSPHPALILVDCSFLQHALIFVSRFQLSSLGSNQASTTKRVAEINTQIVALKHHTTLSSKPRVVTIIVQLSALDEVKGFSLVPRPLPDFISQPWRKIWRRPRIKTMSQTGNGGLG